MLLTNTRLHVQRNMEEADRKREETVQKLLAGFDRKEQQVVKMRESIFGSGDAGGKISNHIISLLESRHLQNGLARHL